MAKKKDNTLLLVGGAIIAYMLLKPRPTMPTPTPTPPQSGGTFWDNVPGILDSLGNVLNNTQIVPTPGTNPGGYNVNPYDSNPQITTEWV